MSLPPLVERYFLAWIGVDTWYTRHLSDLTRFYKFVWAVHRYCRPRKGVKKSKKRLPRDGEIHAAIVDARRETFNAEALEEEATYYSGLYNHLLDFANTPNIPDHIIERKNILSYYHQLTYELGGYMADPKEVAADMKRAWGEGWEELLENEKRRLG
jgi:hypothetical protein